MQLSLAACLKQHWTLKSLKHSYPECHVAIVEWTCHDESQRMELSFDVFGDWGIDVIDHSLLLGLLGGQTPEDWFSSSNYYALLQPVIEMQRLGKTGKHTQRIPFGCFVVQVSWWTGMGCSECPYLRVTICFCMSTTAPTFHVFTCTLTSFVQDNSTSDGISARVGHGSWRKAELRRFSRDWMCVWWENQGQGSRLYNYWLQWDVARANSTGGSRHPGPWNGNIKQLNFVSSIKTVLNAMVVSMSKMFSIPFFHQLPNKLALSCPATRWPCKALFVSLLAGACILTCETIWVPDSTGRPRGDRFPVADLRWGYAVTWAAKLSEEVWDFAEQRQKINSPKCLRHNATDVFFSQFFPYVSYFTPQTLLHKYSMIYISH